MPHEVNAELAELLSLPCLSGLSAEEVEALRRAAEMFEAGDGALIVEQGDAGAELYAIIEGQVAVERSDAGGPARVVTVLGPGSIFGEIGFLTGTPRTASARATRPTRLARFRRETLSALEGPGLRAAAVLEDFVARTVALRLARMNDEIDRAHSQLEQALWEARHAVLSWTAHHGAVSHLADELRKLADFSGDRLSQMTALVREAGERKQRVLHGSAD